MSLQQAISAAVLASPELEKERIKMGITRAESIADTGVLNPFFIFDADPREREYEFGLQKAFETGRQGRHRKRIDQKREEMEETLINARIMDLKAKVINAYTAVYINQEKIKILEDSYNFIISEINQNDKLSALNELLVRGELTDIYQQKEDARIAIKQAISILTMLTGHRITEDVTLVDPTKLAAEPDLSTSQLVEIALKERHESILNKQDIELAKIAKDLAVSNLFPLVIVDAGAEVKLEENTGQFFIGVDVELPVLGAEIRAIERTEERIEQVKKRQKIVEENIMVEVVDSYDVYKTAKERFQEYEQMHIPGINTLLSEIRMKYKNNEISFKDLLEAEKANISIVNNYLTSMLAYKNAITVLENAVGKSIIVEVTDPEVPEIEIPFTGPPKSF